MKQFLNKLTKTYSESWQNKFFQYLMDFFNYPDDYRSRIYNQYLEVFYNHKTVTSFLQHLDDLYLQELDEKVPDDQYLDYLKTVIVLVFLIRYGRHLEDFEDTFNEVFQCGK